MKFLKNRVWMGLLIFLVGVGIYEFHWKPQYKPLYEKGIKFYHAGEYNSALDALQQAYAVAPNATDVSMMLGWTELKLRHYEEARYYFGRTLKIDQENDEARVGNAFVAVETGRGELDPDLLRRILEKRKTDPNVRVLVAAALANSGHAYQSAAMYRDMVRDPHYGATARAALDELYGISAFPGDTVSNELPVLRRAPSLHYEYRAFNRQFAHLSGNSWQPTYLAGVNFSPAAPGFFPALPPTDGSLYAQWLNEAAQLNVNTLRLYTLLPPAFYRAYAHHTDAGRQTALIQQIWVPDPPNNDLWDRKFTDDVRKEIRYSVDAIHGRGDVPPLPSGGGGIYDVDIADHVAALMLGGDINGAVRARTDVLNLERTKYDGKYVSLADGSATEIWYAQMLDYLIEYETTTYNWQHPVAVVNVLSIDPMNNPIEARLKTTPGFGAGLFAAYSAFPYFPETMLHNQQLLRASDREGSNPVYGWLRSLRNSIPYPVLVSEYGMATSLGVSQFQQNGWNHGGHSQTQQAELVRRLHRGIKEADVAGEMVFELIDEWHRHNWPSEGFAAPADHRPMWLNAVDPAPHYGLIGFRSNEWKLYGGGQAEWQTTTKLEAKASASDDPALPNVVRSVRVDSDEAYLYIRLEGACLSCAQGVTPAYAIAINTLPQIAGIQKLPFGNVTVPHGVNFLVYLSSPSDGQLLVADDYNPFEAVPDADVPNATRIVFRRGFIAKMNPAGEFNKLGWQPHKAPDGAPGGDYSLTALRYGQPGAGPDADDSLAEWYADPKEQVIVVRLAWSKLLVTDPSGAQALFGYSEKAGIRTATINGIEVSAFTLKQPGPGGSLATAHVVSSIPALVGDRMAAPPIVLMKRWKTVKIDPYRKKAYFAVQQMFAPVPVRNPAEVQPGRSTASRSTGVGAGR
jgi:tetratricopeptide (TPR) repeat protein